MTNFEDSLPRFPTYQKIVENEGFSFNDSIQREIGELFDQSKWEDRLLMLALIMQRTELEKDPRPSFSKWIKEEILTINDSLENSESGYAYTQLLERYIKAKDLLNYNSLKEVFRLWDTYSDSEKQDKLTLNLMGAYHKLFPQDMVTTTPIGKQCFSSCKSLAQNKLIREYIDDLYFSLTSFLEGAYTRTVSLKKNNENLYLHKYDFNWSEIIHLIWKIDILTWWYREYLSEHDPCWKMDITSIPLSIGSFENSNSYITECLLPMLFNIYGADCKDYSKQCYTRMFNWYSGEYPYDEQDMEESIDDRWSEIHQCWIKEYGSLV